MLTASRLRTAFGLTMVLSALAAAPASADVTASIAGDTIVVTGDGDSDTVVISEQGSVTDGRVWRISGADPGAGCEPSGGGAACDDGRFRSAGAGPSRSWQIDLGEGDDELTFPYNDEEDESAPSQIQMGEGDDEVTSSAGVPHTIRGGAGEDTIVLTSFAPSAPGGPVTSGDPPEPVTVEGGDDDDVLDVSGRSTGDTIRGGLGFDTVSYLGRLAATPVVLALDGVANDGDPRNAGELDSLDNDLEQLIGTPGTDAITGNGGDQTIDGGPAADTLAALGGADTLSFASRSAAVTADLTAGTSSDGDTHSGFEHLRGGGGADTLIGSAGANIVEGGGGNDAIDGRAGVDELFGQAGTQDLATYESRPGPVTASLDGVRANDPDTDLLNTIEDLRGTAAGDTLRGGTGTNRLFGLGGDDTLDGGPGDGTRDELRGGEGARDRADYAARTGGGFLLIQLDSANGEDTLDAVEDVTGSQGIDFVFGTAGINQIDGQGGDDRIRAGLGADVVEGGAGANDELSYTDGRLTAITFTVGGANTDTDTVTGTEQIIGSNLGDTMTGGAGVDRFDGGGGPDTLRGGAGSDTLSGGLGNDLLDPGPGTAADTLIGDNLDADTVDYSTRTEAITVFLSEGDGTATTIDGDQLILIRNVNGGSGADRLVGNSRPNVLRGNGGPDKLDGKGGNDTLNGGPGNDVIGPLRALALSFCVPVLGGGQQCTINHFVASPPPDGRDTITGDADNDILSSVDGALDNAINCGTGTDSAAFDLLDPVPSTTCESTGQAAREQHPITQLRVARVRNRVVRVTVGCPRSRPRACSGRLSLRAGGRVVASRRYRVARGRGRVVRLTVGRRRLARGARVVASERDTRRRVVRASVRVPR